MKLETAALLPETRNLKPETNSSAALKPETRNLKPTALLL